MSFCDTAGSVRPNPDYVTANFRANTEARGAT